MFVMPEVFLTCSLMPFSAFWQARSSNALIQRFNHLDLDSKWRPLHN